MTTPIGDQLAAEHGWLIGNLTRDLNSIGAELTGDGHDLREWLTRHITHVPYHDNHAPREGTTMSALADVETRFENFATQVTAGLDDLRQNAVPAVHDGALTLDRLIASPIVGELQQLTMPLDPALEQAIAVTIRTAGAMAASLAAATAPPEHTAA